MSDEDNKRQPFVVAWALVSGVAIGLIVGLLFDILPQSVAIGAGLGLIVGAIMSGQTQRP